LRIPPRSREIPELFNFSPSPWEPAPVGFSCEPFHSPTPRPVQPGVGDGIRHQSGFDSGSFQHRVNADGYHQISERHGAMLKYFDPAGRQTHCGYLNFLIISSFIFSTGIFRSWSFFDKRASS
jgi:hypothetical protein